MFLSQKLRFSDDFQPSPIIKPRNDAAKIVNRELKNVTDLSNRKLRDSSYIKSSFRSSTKFADSSDLIELSTFRRQLLSLSTPIRESARFSFLTNEDTRRRELQEFQCQYLVKFQKNLQKEVEESGFDIRNFKIGGYERGTYEKFFRVEPKVHITKAQFIIGLRRCFGSALLKSESSISKLFDSFDIDRRDEMDWRSFLFLLTILMQPQLTQEDQLTWGYSLYSSSGSLDLDCREKLTIETIKDLICTPVMLNLRGDLKFYIDQAWLELINMDDEASDIASVPRVDLDKTPLSFRLFKRLCRDTSFSRFFKPGRCYGNQDARVWVSTLEKEQYHPILLSHLMSLRRVLRNEDACDSFIKLRERRIKESSLHNFVIFSKRRAVVRRMIVVSCLRIRNVKCSKIFDHWRAWCLQTASANHLQRVVRGFIARKRRNFIKTLKKRVVKMQSSARRLQSRNVYLALSMRQKWAAVTIQRIIRGHQNRCRVRKIVQAKYDLGRRSIEISRRRWMEERKWRAAIAIQMVVIKFLRRRRTMKKMKQKSKVEKVYRDMEIEEEKGRVAREVHRHQLLVWYAERKEEFEKDRFLESHTAEQRSRIIAYRNRKEEYARLQKFKEREANLEKLEEVRIENWLTAWDVKRENRMKERAKLCRRALQLPETPEEVELKKELLKRVKKHVKNVLRRADKQKIPMEIPEALELATREIIEMEVQMEKKRADEERFAEATFLQAKEEEKTALAREHELDSKKRKRKWAAKVLQKYYRAFCARKVLRAKAYERYKKKFDPESLNYYYENSRTRKTFWKKPKSLGSYDVDPDEGWIVVFEKRDDGSRGDMYFYEPKSWEMQWTQPTGTLMCEVCGLDFVIARLNSDLKSYCERCLGVVAQELSLQMHPSLIKYKPVAGNTAAASKTKLTRVKDTTWYQFLIDSERISKY